MIYIIVRKVSVLLVRLVNTVLPVRLIYILVKPVIKNITILMVSAQLARHHIVKNAVILLSPVKSAMIYFIMRKVYVLLVGLVNTVLPVMLIYLHARHVKTNILFSQVLVHFVKYQIAKNAMILHLFVKHVMRNFITQKVLAFHAKQMNTVLPVTLI